MSLFAKCADAIQHQLGGCRPNERLWIFVVGGDVIVNGGDEFINILEYAPPNPLLGNLRKPSLHLIEPGTAVGVKCGW